MMPVTANNNGSPALRPSEYTAALLRALHRNAQLLHGADALEIGSGSGVVLAAMAEMGANSVSGVDIEEEAVTAGMSLLADMGHGPRGQVHRGDMWAPVAGRRFDFIAANLPHFAMGDIDVAGRYASWSAGGSDGRRLVDPFLKGLSAHLSEGGRTVMTHNGFIGLERSSELAAEQGLELRVLNTDMVFVSAEKLSFMTPEILKAEEGHSIHRYGPYAFAEMHIVEIIPQGQAANAV